MDLDLMPLVDELRGSRMVPPDPDDAVGAHPYIRSREEVTMTAYLIANPPRIRQFRRPRRAKPSGVIVIHTAESFPDEVGPDTGAESVARFIRDRTNYGSYHDLCDSDTIVNLVPYDAEAYHDATGSNPHSLSVSAATQAAKWDQLDDDWVRATVVNMARAAARQAAWLHAEHGIVVPAKTRTRTETEQRMPGFISHAKRDPARRTDPGPSFPWSLFLSTYAALMAGDDPDGDLSMTDVREIMTKLDAMHEDIVQGATTGANSRDVITNRIIAALGPKIDQAVKVGVQGATTAENNRGVISNRVQAMLDQLEAELLEAIETDDNPDNLIGQPR